MNNSIKTGSILLILALSGCAQQPIVPVAPVTIDSACTWYEIIRPNNAAISAMDEKTVDAILADNHQYQKRCPATSH